MLTRLKISAGWYDPVAGMKNQLMGQVMDQVGDKAKLQIWTPVKGRVYSAISLEVRHIIVWHIEGQVGDKVYRLLRNTLSESVEEP